MVGKSVPALALVLCLVGFSRFDSAEAAAEANGPGALDGLWSGGWGLSIDPDGTVHQPVRATLFIQGNNVEWTGFPGVSDFTGTIRIDAGAKQIRVARAAGAGSPPADTIVYSYEIQDDHLRLSDRDKRLIHFTQVRVNPLAGLKIEFLAAVGMNAAGDVLVTDFEVHRASRSGETHLAHIRDPLKTDQAAVFLTQDRGVKKVSIDEVRRLVRGPTPVVVGFRTGDRASPLPSYQRWHEADSEAVGRTIAPILRPGTLVFVVPERARVILP